ncbi:hypothetical protein BH23PLA1_BH23PLA1_05840 [soil metagenome]
MKRLQAGPLLLAIWFLIGSGPVGSARAHDIPDARVDRGIQILLGPGRLRIEYEVALSELTLAQDLRSLEGRSPAASRAELFDRYGQVTAPLNAKGLLVSVDGDPIALGISGFDLSVEEHPLYRFGFEVDLPESGRLEIQDTNYISSEGTSRLALRTLQGIEANSQDIPADLEDVPERPTWMLSFEEERRTRQVALDYRSSVLADTPPIVASKPVASTAPPLDRQKPTAPAPDPLFRLLDRASGTTLLGIWLLALLLGSAHAIQPGHGKTIVAAAVVGRQGAWHQGVLLAMVTTLAHVLGVLAVAGLIFLTRSTRYEAIDRTLVQVAGFWIAAVGLWRLGRHLGGHGEHGGDQRNSLDPTIGNRSLVVLGLAAGILPCWDAILLIILAEAMGRLPLGLLLLSGFSLGMGAVLVAVGLASGRLRRLVDAREQGARWGRWLGGLSGVVLTSIGVMLLWA